MSEIKGTEIVEKRNVLNEIRKNSMTLQELRFFSIYLAKINARDKKTRRVKFKLDDFKKIMGFHKINISQLKESTNSLLSKVVNIPNENGRGYTGFTLFKECKVYEERSEWYIDIEASDKALPLMFDFKSHYFTYELWNALCLKSSNQIRMYEILKQYEHIGKREIEVFELRNLLGIEPKEYEQWSNFKIKVLDSCQDALAKSTDICYTYEKGKSGIGGKWLTIVFYIKKNKNYVDRLSIKDFIDLQQTRSETLCEAQDDTVKVIETKNKPEPLPPENKQNNRTESDVKIDTEFTGIIDKDFTERQLILLSKVLMPKVSPDMNNPAKLKMKLDSIYCEIQLRYETIKNPVALMLRFIKSLPDYTEPTEKKFDDPFLDMEHFEEDYEIFINRF